MLVIQKQAIQTLVESQSHPSEGYNWESTIFNYCLNDFESNFLPKLKPGSSVLLFLYWLQYWLFIDWLFKAWVETTTCMINFDWLVFAILIVIGFSYDIIYSDCHAAGEKSPLQVHDYKGLRESLYLKMLNVLLSCSGFLH